MVEIIYPKSSSPACLPQAPMHTFHSMGNNMHQASKCLTVNVLASAVHILKLERYRED